MRIKRVRIQNFRCLEDVELYFDEVTTLIGSNGAGKSSILRALDWFFNGEEALTPEEEDIFAGSKETRFIVEVEFNNLTSQDRDRLGKYAPEGQDTTIIWRKWDSGEDKISGKALAYPPFEEIRKLTKATEKKEEYKKLKDENPELELPAANTAAAVEEAMNDWEHHNREHLEDAEVSDTNFFGFVGQGKMSGLFDFIFVSADMRAEEETSDKKSAILGRILERTVDRTAANKALEELASDITQKHNEIYEEHFSEPLNSLSSRLSKEVDAFTSGRSVVVTPQHVQVQPQKASFSVRVNDERQDIDTSVDRQGHGFQRTLLIAALKTLSEQGRDEEDKGVICLAIEEPELFQHPLQAKVFASTLRSLAEDEGQAMQVAYATHSPYFIEARKFSQIRRLQRSVNNQVQVYSSTVESVSKLLSGYLDRDSIVRQIDGVCLNELPLALFSEKAIIVEGSTDAAVIDGISMRDSSTRLDLKGVAVTPVGSKSNIFLPSAILSLLGVPHYIVFDGDKGCEERARMKGKLESNIEAEKVANIKLNNKILQFLGEDQQDWPSTAAKISHAVFEDSLETELNNWYGWQTKREELINQDLGYQGKYAATYIDTSLRCDSNPPRIFTKILEKVEDLQPSLS